MQHRRCLYQAAPTTERPVQAAIPSEAHPYGDIDSRAAPTLKSSPLPVKSISAASQLYLELSYCSPWFRIEASRGEPGRGVVKAYRLPLIR